MGRSGAAVGGHVPGLALAMAMALASGAVHAADVVGVAFVHGTGEQTDAQAAYWQPGIIDSVRSGLPDASNYLVVNCDFTQLMWHPDAAGCLAAQLGGFIESNGITRLRVITHSHGGNMMRWILSNPTFDSRYPQVIRTIDRVVALAPSSAGTPLADAVIAGSTFEVALGWLLGYASDAVRQQQVADMAGYNAQQLYGTAGRPSLPTLFQPVVGSDVEVNPMDSDSYCGGYALNLGLQVARAWLDGCSDGFLECSSQRAAGTPWFTDIERTQGAEPLSHNQSRRACFGLDTILRNALTG